MAEEDPSFTLAGSSWLGWSGAGAAPTIVSVRPVDLQRFGWSGAGAAPTTNWVRPVDLQRFGWSGAGAAPTTLSLGLESTADLIVAIPSLSLGITEWLEGSNTLPGTSTSTYLTREQKRVLVGYYAYFLTWVLVLNLVLRAMSENVVYGEALGLITTMTPCNGHKIALLARDVAWRVFDNISPLDDDNRGF